MNVTSIIRLLPDSQEQAELFAQKMFDEWKAGHLIDEDIIAIDHLSTAYHIFFDKRDEFRNDPEFLKHPNFLRG